MSLVPRVAPIISSRVASFNAPTRVKKKANITKERREETGSAFLNPSKEEEARGKNAGPRIPNSPNYPYKAQMGGN